MYNHQLDAFVRTADLGSFSRAAKALYIDRSTLHYRLKKISDLMETDLDVPANAQALSASIWLREIYRFSDGADKQN